MTRNFSKFIILFAAGIFLGGWVKAQEALPASGGEASGSGGSSSYTLGQVVYKTHASTAGTLTQGVQQSIELYTLSNPGLTAVELKATTYPNPTSDFITLAVSKDDLADLSYGIYDIHGRCIAKSVITGKDTQISMQELAAGTYILMVRQNKSEIKTFKIIKK